MIRSERDEFEVILTAKVAELERLIRHRDGITVEASPDELEETQRASERAVAISNLDRDFNQLRDARAALRRIREGSFGTCLECDQAIHPKRLTAIPWASLCIRCQEAVDSSLEELSVARSFRLLNAA